MRVPLHCLSNGYDHFIKLLARKFYLVSYGSAGVTKKLGPDFLLLSYQPFHYCFGLFDKPWAVQNLTSFFCSVKEGVKSTFKFVIFSLNAVGRSSSHASAFLFWYRCALIRKWTCNAQLACVCHPIYLLRVKLDTVYFLTLTGFGYKQKKGEPENLLHHKAVWKICLDRTFSIAIFIKPHKRGEVLTTKALLPALEENAAQFFAI